MLRTLCAVKTKHVSLWLRLRALCSKILTCLLCHIETDISGNGSNNYNDLCITDDAAKHLVKRYNQAYTVNQGGFKSHRSHKGPLPVRQLWPTDSKGQRRYSSSIWQYTQCIQIRLLVKKCHVWAMHEHLGLCPCLTTSANNSSQGLYFHTCMFSQQDIVAQAEWQRNVNANVKVYSSAASVVSAFLLPLFLK